MRLAALLVVVLAMLAVGRVARADDVVATVSGSTLKIKGDPDGNTITLDQAGLAATQVRITGTGTTVNSGPGPVVENDVSALVIDLGSGDDTLNVGVGSTDAVSIKTGAGSDHVIIGGGTLGDKVTVDLGSGDNALALCDVTILGALTIKTGFGAGLPMTADCGPGLATTTNGTAIELAENNIIDKLTLKGSKGGEGVRLDNNTFNDKVTITLGAGGDDLSFCGNDISDALIVSAGKGGGNGGHALCGGAHPSENTASQGNAIAIGGGAPKSVRVKSGSAADVVSYNDGNVTESVIIDIGQGGGILTLDHTAVGERLSLKSGKLGEIVQFLNGAVGGSAIVNAGSGGNIVQVTSSAIGGNLTVKTGNDSDTINTTGTSVGGTKTIKHGGGTDSIMP